MSDAVENTDAKKDEKDEKEKKEDEPAVSFKELYQYATPLEMLMLLVAIICSVGSGVCQPMMLLAFKSLFGSLGQGEIVDGLVMPMDTLLEVLLIMCYIGAGMWVGRWIAVSCIEYITASQMERYKRAYLRAILRQDVGWYDTSNPEELSTIFAEAMVKVQKGFKAQMMTFEGLGYGTGGLIMAFLPSIGNPEVAGITLATVPLLIIAAWAMMYVFTDGAKIVDKAYGKAGGIATECLFSMRTIASLGIEEKFADRYKGSLAAVRGKTILLAAVFQGCLGLALAAYLVMMATAVVYGGYRLAGEMEASQFEYTIYDPISATTQYVCADAAGNFATVQPTQCASPFYMTCQVAAVIGGAGPATMQTFGHATTEDFDTYVKNSAPATYLSDNPSYYGCLMSPTNVLIAIFAVMMMGEGYGMAGEPAAKILVAKQAAYKVFAIIKRVPTIDSFSEEGLKPEKTVGDIEVKDVVFAYPTAPEHNVCNNYSLSIAAGQTVALCGPSGSGKSTIIQLIERFYDPQSGVVTLDGVDIKTLNVRWLRSQLGLVGQEPVLFQGTVAQNIMYGKAGGTATQEEVEEAAKMANAHGFITDNLGNGYETQVGQGGNKLSGGQKQRVAIARAMIKKPAVLLLDEATSALDNKSEKVVQAALDEIMTKMKRTTVVIAHRLSTIRNADKIAVLDGGKVVEEGTYEGLIGKSEGLFKTLAAKQETLLAQDKAAVEAVVVASGGEAGGGAVAAQAEEEGMEVVKTAVVVAEEEEEGADKKKKKKKKKEKKEPEPPVFGPLMMMQREHWPTMTLMVLMAGSACAASTASFYLMVVVMDMLFQVDPAQMRKDAIELAITLAIFAAGIIGCFTVGGWANGVSGSSLTAKLRGQGIAALLRQEIGFFDQDENSATELTAFLSEKVAKVKTITTEQLDLIGQLIGGIGAFIFVIARYSDWRLLLAWLGCIAVMGAVMPLQVAFMVGEDAEDAAKKKGKEDTSKKTLASASANKIVGEAVTGIRTIASFNLEQVFFADFAKSTSTVAHLQKRDACVAGFFIGFTMFIMMGAFGGIMFYSVWLGNEGVVDFNKAMAPMFAVMGIMMPMMKASALADLKNATTSAARLFKLFNRVPTIDNYSEEGLKPEKTVGDIEVKDVVFAYPTALEHNVCNGYSLSIAAGQTVALCGPSGSGKSTIIQLIERFYDPQSGSVSLDGVDIKTLNVRWLRSQLGLVGQEPVLFQGTVAQNIAYGKAGGTASKEEVEEAAKMANAHGFITENLGKGYETDVGLKGGKLSGGQKQRVAIARAIVRKPAVLLLDEATSALDNESERIVQAALDEIMTKMKRTTIVIAHRLSTIRNADKIAVVNEGKIVEQGTHDQLIGNQNLYANLVMASS